MLTPGGYLRAPTPVGSACRNFACSAPRVEWQGEVGDLSLGREEPDCRPCAVVRRPRVKGRPQYPPPKTKKYWFCVSLNNIQ